MIKIVCAEEGFELKSSICPFVHSATLHPLCALEAGLYAFCLDLVT